MSKMSSIAFVMVPNGEGIATAEPKQMAPLAAANINGGEQALLLVSNLVAASDGAGNAVSIVGLTDSADNVAPLSGGFGNLYQGAVVRLTGFDETNTDWDRIRTIPDNTQTSAALAGSGLLASGSRLQGFDPLGGVWNRLYSYSITSEALLQDPFADSAHLGVIGFNAGFNGTSAWAWWRNLNFTTAGPDTVNPGIQVTGESLEWSVNHEPAVAAQASVTKTSNGGGSRLVCRSITATLACDGTASAANVFVRLRDGAAGVGAILWSGTMRGPANSTNVIALSGLNIVGSADTDMTLEFSAAPNANHQQVVSMTGYTTA